MVSKKVFAVIPAHNECRHIADVIKRTKKFVDSIIVVDDGSADDTFDCAEKAGAEALRHVVNMGKGTALKTGCDYAIRKGADIIILIDSDGQHNPEDVPLFLEKLKDDDIVFAYRCFDMKMPLLFKFGNSFINNTINLLYGIHLRDTQCGFRAFKKDVYKKIRWKAMDYTIESEMIAYTAIHRLRYAQVPIKTVYLDSYKGTTVFDGIKIVINILMLKLKLGLIG